LAIRKIIGCINASGLTTNVATISAFVRADGDLARMLITEIAKVTAPKNKKNAPAAGESGNQRPKRRKAKLIRLDDLIPKQDVTGGQRLLFGVTDKTQSTNNPTKEK
jgi:hypothetical protein